MSKQILDPMEHFRNQIKDILSSALTELGVEYELKLEVPPEGLGDFAFPCFNLAPALKKSPQEVAADFAGKLPKNDIIQYSVKGPYLNFSITDHELVGTIIPAIFALSTRYGQYQNRGVNVILEHTSANPTDRLHVGRARNPIIGDTFARVLRSAGYDVETQYYVDDMGRQAALKILENRHENDWDKNKFKTGYQWASSATTADSEDYNPELESELNDIMDGFERGKPEILKESEDVCKEMMDEIIIPSLERINVKIDNFVNESKFMLDNSVSNVIEKLKVSDFSDIEDGAYYIDLGQFNVKSGKDKFFYLRADGKSLYATRDIAYHQWKFQHCDIAINVLGEDHKLESEYVRVGLELLGLKKAPENIFYAFVNLPEGRMSTRKGKVVYLDDLIDESVERALAEVKKRRTDLTGDEMNEIAIRVGMGSIRYNIIRVQAEKKIVFKWEDALNFEGDSAPFIQYAHARACSILRKSEDYSKEEIPAQFRAELVTNPYEIMLVRALGRLPGIIADCAEQRQTHQLASYAHEVSSAFNQFYRECPVLQAETPELIKTRLGLVDATRIVLHNALELLGIAAPEMM